MSGWLNNEKIIWKKAVKPCRFLGFCPYGQLVEEFPLKKRKTKVSCDVFGHDCPVFYHAEPFSEDKEPTDKEVNEMIKEWKQKWKK